MICDCAPLEAMLRELSRSFQSFADVTDEIRDEVLCLIEAPQEFIVIKVDRLTTAGTVKIVMGFEPTDRLTCLMAALGARDAD